MVIITMTPVFQHGSIGLNVRHAWQTPAKEELKQDEEDDSMLPRYIKS
jgi:hypothetical protein